MEGRFIGKHFKTRRKKRSWHVILICMPHWFVGKVLRGLVRVDKSDNLMQGLSTK